MNRKNLKLLIIATCSIICLILPLLFSNGHRERTQPLHDINWYIEYYEQYISDVVFVNYSTSQNKYPVYLIYQSDVPQVNSGAYIETIDNLLIDNYVSDEIKKHDIKQIYSSVNNIIVGNYLYHEIINEIKCLFPEEIHYHITLDIKSPYENDTIVNNNPTSIQKYLQNNNFAKHVEISILVNKDDCASINEIQEIEFKILELMNKKWEQYPSLKKWLHFDISSDFDLYNEFNLFDYFDSQQNTQRKETE